MATAQSHGNQISMENWSSPFWSPSLLGISMWFSSFCSFFPKSDVTPGMLGRFVGGVLDNGEFNKLGFYFNEHIMSIVVLNAMFNNGSNGDRAQFDQAPGLRLFNMQESQKVGTLGNCNQALHPTGDQVCRQGALDQEYQAWQMEMVHAHLRTLDWVLQQEPYPGSDAQSSIDREEEVSCAFAIKDNQAPARSLESKMGKLRPSLPCR